MSTVSLASGYARRLVENEAKRAGLSVKQTIPIVARQIKAPVGAVWGLLFRQPKQVSFDLFTSLEAAVARDLQRQIGALENELSALVARTDTPLDLDEIGKVEAVLAKARATVARGRQ